MPFPFMPYGMLAATAIVAAALTLFGLGMWAIDRGLTAVTGSILPGIVDGVRRWSVAEPEAQAAQVSGGSVVDQRTPATVADADEATGAIEELIEQPPVPTEHVGRG